MMKRWLELGLSLGCLLLVFAPTAASAWGYQGHRVVGSIADTLLTANAQQQVKQILNPPGSHDPSTGHQFDLRKAGPWADCVKASPSNPTAVSNTSSRMPILNTNYPAYLSGASDTILVSHEAFANLSFANNPSLIPGPHWVVMFEDHTAYLWLMDQIKRKQLAKGGGRLAQLLNAIWP
jgi:hypothetical protein